MRATSATLSKILSFTLILFIVSAIVGSAEAATVVAYFNKTYVNANGTSNQIQLDYLSSVSDATVEFIINSTISANFDNSGGKWLKYINIVFSAALVEYAQYKVFINRSTVEVYNVTGALKASGTAANFWTLVNTSGWDIRVFNESGAQLYFWIESWNYTAQTATIWVNVTAGSSELNIAYGNPDALPSSYNNATLTTLFFDDFEDGDISDWTVVAGTWSATSSDSYAGTYSLDQSLAATTGSKIYKSMIVTSPIIIKGAHKNYEGAGTTPYLIDIVDDSDNGYQFVFGFTTDYSSSIRRLDAGAATTLASGGGSLSYYTWYEFEIKICSDGTITFSDGSGATITATDTNYTSFTKFRIATSRQMRADELIAFKLADPVEISSIAERDLVAINATLLLNGNAITYGELNATNPSSGKLAVSSGYFTSGLNWANFTAEYGQFNATLEFNYTLDVPQTESTTYDYMWVNLSTFTIPDGTVTSNTTIAFNTSSVGILIYSYYLKVYVNDAEYSNYKSWDFEIEGVKYINVSVLDVPAGSVSVKVHVIFAASNISVTVYDELSKEELTSKTLNLTLMDLNYNVLKEATLPL